MRYALIIKPKARKNLNKIPIKYRGRIILTLETIREDPFSGRKLFGKRKGQFSFHVWPYRIVYTIEKRKLIIIVIDVGPRGGVYK